MKRKAFARWDGNLQEGRGWLTTESGVLKDQRYSFGTRFKEEKGTNPEELIGAAHAGCFSMALASDLTSSGLTPKTIDTAATVTLEKLNGNWTITASHLEVEADVPGLDAVGLQRFAEQAKSNCPVSRMLQAELSVASKLISASEPRRQADSTI